MPASSIWREAARRVLPGGIVKSAGLACSATGRVALLVLNQQGAGNFVSRAEAQSLMRGMEQLREVRLDFTGVEGVGSGFAEEIFAVWAAAHPKVRIRVLNANPVVQRVIDHAASAMTES